MSESLVYINHSWLKLRACFFFVAIDFTKQCWYRSQQFHSFALSFLHTTSSDNYTKLDMCIWLWCVANDCPHLSNSNFNSFAQYDWTCTGALLVGGAQQVPCHVRGAVWHNYFTSFQVSWRLTCCFLCLKNWAEVCSEYMKEQGLLGRTRHIWEYSIKMDL
jgi:hypothetical protein